MRKCVWPHCQFGMSFDVLISIRDRCYLQWDRWPTNPSPDRGQRTGRGNSPRLKPDGEPPSADSIRGKFM